MLNQRQEVQSVVGETGVHMGSLRETDCVCTHVCVCVCLCAACTQMVQFLRGRKTGSDEAREPFFAVPSGIIHDFTDQNYLFQHSLDVNNKPVICRSRMSQLPAPSCWVPVGTAQPSCPHLLEWHLLWHLLLARSLSKGDYCTWKSDQTALHL